MTSYHPSPLRVFGLRQCIVAVVGLCALPSLAQPVPRAFREAFVVETDATAEKKLSAVVEYFDQQRWDAGLALLREVVAANPDALIRVSPSRSISLARYADVLLTQLPAEGLTIYRQGVDPQAAAWLAESETTGDHRPLQLIVDRAFASSAGDAATLRLAERAWERGEFDLARRFAMLLIPLRAAAGERLPLVLRTPSTPPPNSDRLDLARVRSRLVLCSLAQGEYERAAQEIEAFRHEHPDATGRIAGEEGRLADRLEQLLAAATSAGAAQDRQGWSVLPPRPVSTTFGASSDRSGRLTEPLVGTAPLWFRPLAAETRAPVTSSADAAILSRYPVLWNSRVFVADADRVYGFDLESGRAAWAVDDDDPGVLYPPVDADVPAAEEPVQPPGRQRPAASPTVLGTPRYTLTVHRDRLYARLGSPVTAWPARELRRPESTLVCLDLAREGMLSWALPATALDGEDQSWVFEGPPVADGDRLFVLASRGRPQAQLNALCLDAATGIVLWNRKIGAPISLPPEGAYAITHRLVTVAAGLLYVQTNQGAVVCLHPDDGRLVWVGWYESRPRGADAANATESHGPSACLAAGGVVVAAPTDSDRFVAYDAATGVELWNRVIRGTPRSLIAAHDGRLVVSGERLECLDLWTGRELWSAGFEDPPGAASGRGLLARDRVYWPTREDLFVIDLTSGEPVRRLPLRQLYGFSGGGNLIGGEDTLILARPDGVLAFGEP